ncbi:rod shape-determining protein [Paraburkholderia caribensis MBA4]|uniref:Rod shape-determining protein n=1 Tax=Paraburkholderia caribensis MBA4 TaxID=1323664 RepID=A0A0P0RHT4_9BURK|nr:rod shape-determining protein [Paraburkholderia caribensis MBA4]
MKHANNSRMPAKRQFADASESKGKTTNATAKPKTPNLHRA